MLSVAMQKVVVAEIRKRMSAFKEKRKSEIDIPLDKACLFWAWHTLRALWARDIEAQLQAGTACWMILDDQSDEDGELPNRFGYEFEWSAKTRQSIIDGMFPEMHVWVAVAGRGKEPDQIIDVTVPYFEQRAREDGFKVNMKLPDFLWCEAKNGPGTAWYEADAKAISLAYSFMKGALSGQPVTICL